jgi:hypothetical protein
MMAKSNRSTQSQIRAFRMIGGVATEHGPKILPISVLCRKPAPSGFFTAENFRAQFGFAYSGSTLAALAAHALANIVCGNLIGREDFAPPSLHDIAAAVGSICLQYMRDVCALSGRAGLFRAVLFGFCPQLKTPLLYQLTPVTDGYPIEISLERHELIPDQVVIIGDQAQLLRDRIAERREKAEHPIIAADAPKDALQSLIDDGSIESVGGTIQQGWVSSHRFDLVATARPIEPQPPSSRNYGRFLLGFDIDSMPLIGSYQVSMVAC